MVLSFKKDSCTTNIVPNGHFRGGTILPFKSNQRRQRISAQECDESGDCKLRFKGENWMEGPTVDVSPDCFSSMGPDATWKASFNVKLSYDDTGDAVACDGSILYCPWLVSSNYAHMI